VVKVTGYGALAFAPRELGGQRVRGRRVHTAPEQIIGGRESFSLQTDVYLLGVTMYECITGKVPYADQADFFDHAVLTLPLPPIEPGLCPPALEKVILKACAKKVQDRYSTPLAMREAIEAAVGELPSNEELAKFMKQLFPGSDEARAARKQTIDAAIAEAARKQWGERQREAKKPPPPPPPPAPVQPPTPSAPAAIPTPMPSPSIVRPRPDRKAPEPGIKITYRPPPEPERSQTRVPWALVAAILVGAVGVFWWASRGDEQLPATRQGLAALDAGQKKVAVAPLAAVVDAGTAEESDAAVVAMPTPAPTPTPTPPPTPTPVAAATVDAGAPVKAGPTVLQLEVNPPCEVTIDGKQEGKTPLKLELTPGRKVLKLENHDLGINTGRVITLKEGATAVENISIGSGTVLLSAPDGAAIFMDGKRIGTAPMKEIPAYEGAHRILVTVGRAKWSEPFSIHTGENIRFNVELE
jgi:serine/threonine-protein kinase